MSQGWNYFNYLAVIPTAYLTSPERKVAKEYLLKLKDIEDYFSSREIYAYIDSEGNYRIEHIKYFLATSVIDLTQEAYRKYIRDRFDYSFDKIEVPKREIWSEKYFVNNPYKNQTIVYENDSLILDVENKKEYKLSAFLTDLDGILSDLESVSEDDFVLIALNTLAVVVSNKDNLGVYHQNYLLSNEYLTEKFNIFDRPYHKGELNGVEIEFESTKNIKKQKEVIVNDCELDISTDNGIKTYIGIAKIEKMAEDIYGKKTMELSYNLQQ
jgi:hypothetical protein